VVVVEEVRVVLAHHRAAAPAGRDDVLVRLEHLDEPLGQLARLVVEPVVEERLAAARLGLGKLHGAAEVLEDLGHGDPDLGVELVGEACDEQSDGMGHMDKFLRVRRGWGAVKGRSVLV